MRLIRCGSELTAASGMENRQGTSCLLSSVSELLGSHHQGMEGGCSVLGGTDMAQQKLDTSISGAPTASSSKCL